MENTLKLTAVEHVKNVESRQQKNKRLSGLSKWAKAYFSLINNTMAMK